MIAEKTNESSIADFLLPDKVLEVISFNLDKNKDIIGSWKTKPINIVVENIKDTYSFTNINKGTSPLDGRNVTRKLKLIGNIILYARKTPIKNSVTLKNITIDRNRNLLLFIAGKIKRSILYKIKGKAIKTPE